MKNLLNLLFLLSLPIFLSCGEDKVTNNDDKNSISEKEYFHVRGNIVDRNGNYISTNYQDEAPIVELYKTSDDNFGQHILLNETKAESQGLFVFDSVKNDKDKDFFIAVKYEDLAEKYPIAQKDSVYKFVFDEYMEIKECGNLRVILLDNDSAAVKNATIKIKKSNKTLKEKLTNDQGIVEFSSLPLNSKLRVLAYNENDEYESKIIYTHLFDCNGTKTEIVELNKYGSCCNSTVDISLSSSEYIHDVTKAKVKIFGGDMEPRIKSPNSDGNLSFDSLCNYRYNIKVELDSFQTSNNSIRVWCNKDYQQHFNLEKCNEGQIIINTSSFFGSSFYKDEKINWVRLFKDGNLIEEKLYNPPLESSTNIVFKNLLTSDIYYRLIINYSYINYDDDYNRWETIDTESNVRLYKCNEVEVYYHE